MPPAIPQIYGSETGAVDDAARSARASVLVVDDEPMIRLIITEGLADAGFDVLEAENADDALDVLDSDSRVGTLITDVKMPGRLDGLDLAELVASRWEHISLVVLSGDAYFKDQRLPSKAAILQKPITLDALLRHVGRA
jgi:DNA-binding NtrC family response regulator